MLKKKWAAKGIRLLTLSTSIRWFGWGLGEAFLPLFLLLFSATFLEAGMLASVYNLVFFLAIPMAGYLADNIKIRKMLLISLIIYLFIGLGYFLAGVMSAIIFIILARGLNGISYSLDQVGRETYFIRHSSKRKIARVFGKFDAITNLWWMIAVIIGFFLVKFMAFQIHWLLFFIIPTSLISFFVVLNLKEKIRIKIKKLHLCKAYKIFFNDLRHVNKKMKIVLFLSFMTGILSSTIYFFVPISSYLHEENLVGAASLALVYTIPLLFSKAFGKIVDKKKEKVYLGSFLSIVLVLLLVAFTKNYWVLLVIMFVTSAIFELISLTNKGMLSRLADRTHLGEVDGSLNGIAALGAVVGPICFGLLLDFTTQFKAYSLLAFVALLAFIVSYIWLKRLPLRELKKIKKLCFFKYN